MKTPDLLVDASWLSAHVRHPGVRVVNVGWSAKGGMVVTQREFEDGHIPGAAHVDVDTHLASKRFVGGPGRHPLPTPERFADRMAALGVDDEMLVVAYDAAGGSFAARLWWMLWVTGHRAVVLDGGLPAWQEGGGALETGPALARDRAMFTAVAWPTDRIVSADAVRSTIRSGAAPVLDARVEARYRADEEPLDPVAGHIPGARSAAWTANLGDDGRFLPAAALAERYRALGVTGDAAIAYCGSGVTACHDIFAMRLAGFGDTRLYEGSWSDWIHDETNPIATGDEPGTLA